MSWFFSFSSWFTKTIRKETRELTSYPETVVLVISTHGMIQVEHKYDKDYTERDIPKYTIPEGIAVYKATSVPPGTCNFVDSETIKHFVKKIQKTNLEKTNDESQLLEKMQVLISDYSEIQHSFSTELHRDIQTNKRAGLEFDKEAEDFLHTYERGQLVSKYTQCAPMLNKTYLRNNTEMHELFDWQIIAINMVGLPDLVPYIQGYKRNHGSSKHIDTSDIIEFLKNKGTSRIIMFDLACSNFRSIIIDDITGEPIVNRETGNSDLYDSDMTDATMRRLRRNLLQERLE